MASGADLDCILLAKVAFVGIQRSVADRNGKHLDVGNCIVFQFKDDRVIDGREHLHDLYAWDEFWA